MPYVSVGEQLASARAFAPSVRHASRHAAGRVCRLNLNCSHRGALPSGG